MLRSYSFIVMCAMAVSVNGLRLQEGVYLLIWCTVAFPLLSIDELHDWICNDSRLISIAEENDAYSRSVSFLPSFYSLFSLLFYALFSIVFPLKCPKRVLLDHCQMHLRFRAKCATAFFFISFVLQICRKCKKGWRTRQIQRFRLTDNEFSCLVEKHKNK